MRRLFLLPCVLLIGACAAPAPQSAGMPPSAQPRPTTEEVRQKCLGQMYAARMRGAVHWHIYENCIKEHG